MRLAALLLLNVPLVALAEPTQYVCVVKHELTLDSDGAMTPYPNSLEVGKTFVVNRITGEIVGRPLTNSTARKIEIVTQGDDERNFEVFSPSVDGIGKATTGLLIVREWEDGPVKPFIALDGNIYSGTCE